MVFKDMNIGTCKPSNQDLERIPHHLIDIIKPDTKFDVGLFVDITTQRFKK